MWAIVPNVSTVTATMPTEPAPRTADDAAAILRQGRLPIGDTGRRSPLPTRPEPQQQFSPGMATATSTQATPHTPVPDVERSEGGSVGQRWRVIDDSVQQFMSVIVRESVNVESPEVRRILPGEICTQRGLQQTDPRGIVRMPIEPSGWVTVHAKAADGPTFLEMVGQPRAGASMSPATPAGTFTSMNAPSSAYGSFTAMRHEPSPPRSRSDGRGFPAGALPPADASAAQQWTPPFAIRTEGPRYSIETMLQVRRSVDAQVMLATVPSLRSASARSDAVTLPLHISTLHVPMVDSIMPMQRERERTRDREDHRHPASTGAHDGELSAAMLSRGGPRSSGWNPRMTQ
eukprot:NODE_5678_length_1745_cov_1.321384.p1 GENE.NODE_5678_length_1745_cov_1.321384~~NODE_5678_length_1745_cov_1.321384.p1  ORF type:complete len:346 (-),score=69.26 NODE_5678_length_1745_cov_1.321384:707-1744(-)